MGGTYESVQGIQRTGEECELRTRTLAGVSSEWRTRKVIRRR